MTTLIITIEGAKDQLEMVRTRLVASVEEFVEEENENLTVDWEWGD